MLGLSIGLVACAMRGIHHPTLDLDFTQGVLPPGLTFTRASTATYIGSDGLLKTAAVGEPRFDYDPITLACKGLLIEGARTNGVAASRDYNNAFWTKNIPGSLTLTSDANIALDGTLSADRFDTNAASCGVYRAGVHTGLAIGDTVSMTLVVKPLSGYCKIRIGYDGTAFTTAQHGIFDLIAGTSAVFGAANVRRMVLLPSGYWLITLTATATAAGNASVSIYSHDATVQSFCADHSQSELGPFSTSIIPTVASAVTRTADLLTMTGVNFSRWFNPEEGTFVVEVLRPPLTTSGTILNAARAAAGYGPRHQLTVSTSSSYAVVNNAGTAIVAGIVAGTVPGSGAVKLTAGYISGTYTTSLNGAAPAAQVAADPPTGLDTLYIGQAEIGADFLNGHIRRLGYYRTRLSNSELQRLTA